MADFPYTPNPASIKRFFLHIQTGGVPEKVTLKYLEQVGFKSKNDRSLLAVLKFVGFVDSSGTPTRVWQAYRSKDKARRVLAAAIRQAYADLFKTFPDAHRKDNEALRNYFSAHTKVGGLTLGLIVRTFKALVEAADFESAVDADLVETEPMTDAQPKRATAAKPPHAGSLPAININIQLQLPATEDASVYEKLFAAMKKHLLAE